MDGLLMDDEKEKEKTSEERQEELRRWFESLGDCC
jgi:hypothetical protein|tara:strand:- start:863 stop:967 length:105 start_codon:yes stop_codon:yes gene_type:complete